MLRDAVANLDDLEPCVADEVVATLHVLKNWTTEYFADHKQEFQQRIANGFIRECHGDLHLANIVHWNDELIPFDGIEFNDDFRWIDVMSDAAFLAMDFAARGPFGTVPKLYRCLLGSNWRPCFTRVAAVVLGLSCTSASQSCCDAIEADGIDSV